MLGGLGLVAAVVAASYGLNWLVPTLSPLIWAIGVGVALAPAARRVPATAPGVELAGRSLLRLGVAFLGFRISADELATVGVGGLVVAVGTVVATLGIAVVAGRRLGVERKSSLLIAAGSSICGASAIAGMNGVVKADERAVGYAVATVTVFGTLAMLLVPVLAVPVLGLSEHAAGMWAGASVHEVAQVTAAGAAISTGALEVATLVKLARVVMLGPVIVAMSALESGERSWSRVRVPAFVVAFVAIVAVGSVVHLPATAVSVGGLLSTLLLAAGLAALGLQIELGALRSAGWRPMALGLVAWVGAAVVSLLLVLLVV